MTESRSGGFYRRWGHGLLGRKTKKEVAKTEGKV